MLTLHFEGWFQCRLATDPDPSDDPRGVSGPTFAVAGEPDLDRIIRFNDPVALRWPLSQIGVCVTQVALGDATIPDHPLQGARVDLLNGAKFEGRNFLIAGTGREPIDPFVLQVSGGGITLRRNDFWDPIQAGSTGKDRDILDVPAAMMDRRQPTFTMFSPEVAEATGIMDFPGFRQKRCAALQARRAQTSDPTECAALDRRIQALLNDGQDMPGVTGAAMIFLGVQEVFAFEINGVPSIDDPDGRLGGQVGISQTWPIRFWMGGFDTDTLTAYTKGTLSIPFFPNR